MQASQKDTGNSFTPSADETKDVLCPTNLWREHQNGLMGLNISTANSRFYWLTTVFPPPSQFPNLLKSSAAKNTHVQAKDRLPTPMPCHLVIPAWSTKKALSHAGFPVVFRYFGLCEEQGQVLSEIGVKTEHVSTGEISIVLWLVLKDELAKRIKNRIPAI